MPTKNKICSLKAAQKKVADLKQKSKKTVFTNGCFDIVHLGHVDYLEKAKSLGDFLIVGINSDQSIQNIKGKDRPIIDEKSRSRLIAAMEFVDMVVLFDEETPLNLIKNLKPDILVKGNDYSVENIVGADVVKDGGGKIETIKLVKGYSTTSIINKIKD